jgi:hypothetical protein
MELNDETVFFLIKTSITKYQGLITPGYPNKLKKEKKSRVAGSVVQCRIRSAIETNLQVMRMHVHGRLVHGH